MSLVNCLKMWQRGIEEMKDEVHSTDSMIYSEFKVNIEGKNSIKSKVHVTLENP